jgi:hypothetical protein
MNFEQALALLPRAAETTQQISLPAQPVIRALVKSYWPRESTPEDRKLPPNGPHPVSGGLLPVASGPLQSLSLAKEVEAIAKCGCGQIDGSSSVFLSSWVARVSPAPSARSGLSSPNGSVESEPSSPPATPNGVELVDDWGFDWDPIAGHHPFAEASCSGADEFDVLALLRAPSCSRGGWSGSSSGTFCPELELPV